jgi:hypothetical protein
LPQHVETIGPHLDHSDLVDTLPVSVGTVPVSGTQRLHATLANGGNRRIRELLSKGQLKLTFDTHIAHRKSSYVSLGCPWAKGDGPSVDRVLATFAGNYRIRWTTLPTATALSLHGVARADADASHRLAEIAEWSRRSEAWTPDGLMRHADFTWHFLRVLLADPPAANGTLAEYLAGMGTDWNNKTSIHPGDSETSLAVHLEEPQRRAIETVFDLFQGRLVPKEDVARVLPHLLDIVLGTIVSIKSGLRVLEPFGNAGAVEIVQRAQRDEPESGHLTSLLEAHLLTAAKRVTEARAIAERLARESTLPGYDLTRLLTRIELAEGRPDAAAERMEAAWQEKPNVTAVGLELAGVLIAANRKDRAMSVCRELEQRLGPTHRGLVSLYRRLGNDPGSVSPAPGLASRN